MFGILHKLRGRALAAPILCEVDKGKQTWSTFTKDCNTTKHTFVKAWLTTNHQVREGSAHHGQTAQTHLHSTHNINAIWLGLTQGLLNLTLTPFPIRLWVFPPATHKPNNPTQQIQFPFPQLENEWWPVRAIVGKRHKHSKTSIQLVWSEVQNLF